MTTYRQPYRPNKRVYERDDVMLERLLSGALRQVPLSVIESWSDAEAEWAERWAVATIGPGPYDRPYVPPLEPMHVAPYRPAQARTIPAGSRYGANEA